MTDDSINVSSKPLIKGDFGRLSSRGNVVPEERAIHAMRLLLDRHRELCLQLLTLEPTLSQHPRKLTRQRPLVVVASEERDRLARLAPAPRSPDAVDVVFDCERERVVDYGRDVRNVEAPRGYVRRNKQARLPTLEILQRVDPRRLRHVPVQASDGVPLAPEHTLNARRLFLVQSKYEDACVLWRARLLVR